MHKLYVVPRPKFEYCPIWGILPLPPNELFSKPDLVLPSSIRMVLYHNIHIKVYAL